VIATADLTLTMTGWQVLTFVVGVVLPLLVGLVTTHVTSASTKAVLLLALSVVTSLLTQVGDAHVAGQSYDVGQGLITALAVFVEGVALHFGLWKPVGASDALQSVGSSQPPAQSDVVHG
jgi:hypothetical protein